MSKNWTFQKIIGLGLNFTYEFEVCFKLHGVGPIDNRPSTTLSNFFSV